MSRMSFLERQRSLDRAQNTLIRTAAGTQYVTLFLRVLEFAIHGGDLASTEMLNPVGHVGLLAP